MPSWSASLTGRDASPRSNADEVGDDDVDAALNDLLHQRGSVVTRRRRGRRLKEQETRGGWVQQEEDEKGRKEEEDGSAGKERDKKREGKN